MQQLIGIVIIAVAVGCYWAWRFYHKSDKKIVIGPTNFGKPFPRGAGPARNSDGSCTWESDELVSSPGDRLAMLDESPGIHRRCPKCGSRRWTKSFKDGQSFKDVIHCRECQTIATDDPDLRKQAQDAGLHCYHIADFVLGGAIPCN